MLPENETIQFEDQLYVNPEASLNEQTTFIDNLRNVQNQNNAQIKSQTENLGTYPASQSNLGGLVGGGGYFTSRYQTPQTNSLVANLRATAQAQALNDVLSNELAMQKQRYNKAYKAAAKRRGSYGGGGGGGGGEDPELPITGGVEEKDTTGTVVGVVPGVPSGYTVGNIIPDWDNMTTEVVGYTYVPYGQEGKTNYVYGSGGSGSSSKTTQKITNTNKLGQTNNLPSWGKL